MTGKDGEEHSPALAADAQLTLDGKACQAADLKAVTRIRVTTGSADKGAVSRIEGLDKNREFAAQNRHEGKIVSIAGSKLVVTGAEGSADHACTLAATAKITCDGKVCKAGDLKPGMRVRITTSSGEPHADAGDRRRGPRPP
jgi:hypothetical protein